MTEPMTSAEALAVLREVHVERQLSDGSICAGCDEDWPCTHAQAVDVLAAELGLASQELLAALEAHVKASAKHRSLLSQQHTITVETQRERWKVIEAAAWDAYRAEDAFNHARQIAINAEVARLAEATKGAGA